MSSADLLLREATPEDAAEISALIHSLARYFLVDPAEPERAAAFVATIAPSSIAGYISSGDFRYHLAESGGRIVGAVAVRDNSHLYHLFVAEAYHGRGIAARLWTLARSEAVARGNPGRFTVNSSVSAIPLYEHLGFVATAPVVRKDGIAFQPMELPGPSA